MSGAGERSSRSGAASMGSVWAIAAARVPARGSIIDVYRMAASLESVSRMMLKLNSQDERRSIVSG
jgi:hypothetical protein